MKHNAFFMVGLICAIIVILLVLVGPLFIKWDPIEVNLADKFIAPQGFKYGLNGHILGTDQLGRDILSRLLLGGRYSLIIAVITVILQNILGVVMGVISGYFGGAVDSVIMRLCEVILAIPLWSLPLRLSRSSDPAFRI